MIMFDLRVDICVIACVECWDELRWTPLHCQYWDEVHGSLHIVGHWDELHRTPLHFRYWDEVHGSLYIAYMFIVDVHVIRCACYVIYLCGINGKYLALGWVVCFATSYCPR